MVLRSLLFAPANHARHVEKALDSAADGAILDLEDAVAIPEKPAARAAAAALLRARAGGRVSAFVRINGLSTPFAYDDLRTVVGPGLDGVVVPKVESAAQVEALDWLLAQLEREQRLAPGSVRVLPIVETAVGVLHAREIATAAARVLRLNFGAGDFTLDTGMTWSLDQPGTLWARIQVVVASRAAALPPPVDTVFPNLADAAGLEAEALQAKRIGFEGKACIHPRQVDVVNAIFTPAPEEVAQARRVVAAFEAATAGGVASIQVDGHFIDYPVAEKARRTLELAERLAAAGSEGGNE